MDLERVKLEDMGITSFSFVKDNDLDKEKGTLVALILYSGGGNIVIFFKDGYTPEEVLVAGEKYVGETLNTNRFKVYKAEVI